MWGKPHKTLSNILDLCITHKSLKHGKSLQAYIIRSGKSSNTFLCNRLIELYSKCNDLTSARHLFDEMPERNSFSWNTMLSALCAANKVYDAKSLFSEMPERDALSWNCMISALVRDGDHGTALELYGGMVSEGFVPTRYTLASVLSACGGLEEVCVGRVCHGVAVKVGLDVNLYVGNSLLSMYAKCGCVDEAMRVFGELSEPNEVSYTALMSGLADCQRVDEAFRMFKLMHRAKVCLDAKSLSSVLGVCARGEGHGSLCKLYGRLVHGVIVKLGFENDCYIGNSLLDVFTKTGDMDSADEIFRNLPELNVVSWNIMIAGYGKMSRFEKVVELMERMKLSGFEPDEVTIINMLTACVRSGNVVVGRQVFDKMAYPSLCSWNAMLSAYSQTGKHDEAVLLFREMQGMNIKPDRTTSATVLGSCAEIGLLECGKQIHAVSIQENFHRSAYIVSGLITLYSKSGRVDLAKIIFAGLPELDTVCCNSLMAGFSINGLEKEAFDLFNFIRSRNMVPSQITYTTILSCCSKQSFSSQGTQVHGQILKSGFFFDFVVGSALIDMYCKCGDVEEARQLFDAMPVKNVVVWNEMINGYAKNGYGQEALHLYNGMIAAGENPDDITFIALLTACSHSGLLDDGIRIIESLQIEHGIEPLLDHYICFIDTLGRAGRLPEAELLINKTPFKENYIIWEVLLSSCRAYDDIPVANRAAEKLMSLNPGCSAPYVLLANLFSSMGRWEEVREVRARMSEQNVHKDTGYSWTEITSEVD